MYNEVSDDFKKAIREDVRTVRMVLKITLKNNKKLTYTDNHILRNSLYINRRCVSGNNLEFGCLNSSELGAAIKNDYNKRYDFFGATIEPIFGLYIESKNSYEDVKLGEFIVNKSPTKNHYIHITAFDNMMKFDKKIPVDKYVYDEQRKEYVFSGCINEFIVQACNDCGVFTDLKSSQLNDYPNYNEIFRFSYEYKNLSLTYRDMLSNALQLMGAFGYLDERGYFCIGHFLCKPNGTFTPRDRFSLDYEDYNIKNFCVEFNQLYSSINNPSEEKFIIDISNNIFLSNTDITSINSDGTHAGWDQVKGRLNDIVYNNLTQYARNLRYKSATMDYPGDPTISLGQMLNVNPIIPSLYQYYQTYEEWNGIKGSDLNGLIVGKESDYEYTDFNILVMEHNWVYRGKSTIRSFGVNNN